ncbi:MAG: ammonium transporter [Dehalococcoidia bacterium]
MERTLSIARRLRRPGWVLAGGLLGLATVSSAFAQEPTTEEQLADLAGALDTGWLLLTATLVLFMQAGFAMVEAGFVRSKNVTNILMKNILDGCFGAIAFWAVGWALAYGVSGEASNGFAGDGHFFLRGFGDDYAGWFFQFVFAATAATIVSGAMAERTKFSAYLVYSIFISAFIYPIVVHWGWDGNGWMSAFNEDPALPGSGYIDFAGSGIVHMVGGFAGLMGAIIVGPRLGKYNADGTVNPIPGHSVSLGVLGMFILWIGWYGFNAGSTLGLSGGLADLAAKVAVTTSLAAATGACTVAITTRFITGKYDMGLTINGLLAGLVGITAGTATVDIWASIVIGAVAALIMLGGVRLLDNLKIDDPVGAVSVHGLGGLWGVLAVGLFSTEAGLTQAAYADPSKYGLLLGGGAEQFIAQLVGAGAILAWTVVTAGALFLAIKYTIGLRVSEEEEIRGLDVDEHGLEAYPEFSGAPLGVFGFGGPRGPETAPQASMQPNPQGSSGG